MKFQSIFRTATALTAACLLFASCGKDGSEPTPPPVTLVTTGGSDNITVSSARISGSFSVSEGTGITKAGFKYMSAVGTAGWSDVEATPTGSTFTATLNDLASETEYSYYAYVIVEGSTAEVKGDTKKFATKPKPVTTLVTTPAEGEGITFSTTWATVYGYYSLGTGEQLDEMGILYWKKSEAGNESLRKKSIYPGSMPSESAYNFLVTLSNLTAGTEYQYVAYVKVKGRATPVVAADDQIRDFNTYGTEHSGVTLTLGGFNFPSKGMAGTNSYINGGTYTLPAQFDQNKIEKIVIAYKVKDDESFREFTDLSLSNGNVVQNSALQTFGHDAVTGNTFSVKLRMYFTVASGLEPVDSNVLTHTFE